jgi:hypothetical protein
MAIVVIPEPGNLWPSTLQVTYNANGPNLAEGEISGVRIDSKGRLIITQEKRATYSAVATGLALASSCTDFFEIRGAATKTIIVKHIRISGFATGTVQATFLLVKRSTANSGGTPVACTSVSHDSTNPPAKATVQGYTANPTTGTLVGAVRAPVFTLVAPGSNYVADILELSFGIEEDQGIILRGLNELLCLNLNGATVSGASLSVSVEWREVVG